MKKLFKPTFDHKYIDIILLITRLSIASFMLTHGIPKLAKFFSNEPVTFSDPLGIGIIPSLSLAIFAEVFCSVLVLIGLGTRLAVIPLIITMLVAAFIVHSSDGFGKQEMALHYLLTYGLLLVTGSGKYSVDQLLFKKTEQNK